MPRRLPPYALIDRTLPPGLHPYLAVLPRAAGSPAMRRIATPEIPAATLLAGARIRLEESEGYAWIDDETPCIVLTSWYYRNGARLDLYLDLLHELTHLRQLAQGMDVWDQRYQYVDRITEIEGYAVAVEEGRRLGMTDVDVVRHLSNPWMTSADVERLAAHIGRFLAERPYGSL